MKTLSKEQIEEIEAIKEEYDRLIVNKEHYLSQDVIMVLLDEMVCDMFEILEV
jgi:hypothetical protein